MRAARYIPAQHYNQSISISSISISILCSDPTITMAYTLRWGIISTGKIASAFIKVLSSW